MNKTKHPALLFPVLPPNSGQFAAKAGCFLWIHGNRMFAERASIVF